MVTFAQMNTVCGLQSKSAVLWIATAEYSFIIEAYLYYIKSLLESYDSGMGKAGVYVGQVSNLGWGYSREHFWAECRNSARLARLWRFSIELLIRASIAPWLPCLVISMSATMRSSITVWYEPYDGTGDYRNDLIAPHLNAVLKGQYESGLHSSVPSRELLQRS